MVWAGSAVIRPTRCPAFIWLQKRAEIIEPELSRQTSPVQAVEPRPALLPPPVPTC